MKSRSDPEERESDARAREDREAVYEAERLSEKRGFTGEWKT